MIKGAFTGIVAVLAAVGLVHGWAIGWSLAAVVPVGLLLALLLPVRS